MGLGGVQFLLCLFAMFIMQVSQNKMNQTNWNIWIRVDCVSLSLWLKYWNLFLSFTHYWITNFPSCFICFVVALALSEPLHISRSFQDFPFKKKDLFWIFSYGVKFCLFHRRQKSCNRHKLKFLLNLIVQNIHLIS